MAMQRTSEGMSGAHSYSREGAEPFAVAQLREQLGAAPPKTQQETIERVRWLARRELRSAEFAARLPGGKRPGSALTQYLAKVYGIRIEEL